MHSQQQINPLHFIFYFLHFFIVYLLLTWLDEIPLGYNTISLFILILIKPIVSDSTFDDNYPHCNDKYYYEAYKNCSACFLELYFHLQLLI